MLEAGIETTEAVVRHAVSWGGAVLFFFFLIISDKRKKKDTGLLGAYL